MLFRNSLRLLMENFKSAYRIMLYKFLVNFIAIALCSVMILPELLSLWNSAPTQELLSAGKDFFSALLALDSEKLTLIKEVIFGADGALKRFADLIGSETTGIVLTLVGCLLIYLVKRFAETLCYFSVGSILNDKMSTYAETSFATAYVSNLGKASRYSLIYVPTAFLFDVLAAGLILLTFTFFGILSALFLSMTLLVLIQALKLLCTGLWMPALTADNKSLREAFGRGDKTERRQMIKLFANYIVVVYVVIIVNVMALIATFGSALLITVPASYMFFICQQYVNYYTIKGKKYFITYERIATNPDRGDREHFFAYLNQADKTGETDETDDAIPVKQQTQDSTEKQE